jgi:glycosyltransferase involved in cell wall biosynthesis
VLESYVSDALGATTAVDHFIGISEFVTNRMIAAGIPRDKITTVYNFVAAEHYEPRYTSDDYVVFFGRLEAVKGIYTVLEALAGLPHIKLKIAGAGNEAAAVAQWVADRQLSNVELLGFVSGSQLHELISGAVCALAPSEWHEPFGLTALEAMALGTPVIATRMGGLPEVVTHETDGLLIPPWDPEALAAAVADLFQHRDRAAEMGRAGRAKVVSQFNRADHYAQLQAVYQRARDGV